MRTVLFVGAGRHQRRAIERARGLGLRVVAVDRNPEAPGLAQADVGETVDFRDVSAVAEVGRRHGVDGVLTVSADRAVPVVAAVAEALGLPGIGSETAHLMTHKIAMRRQLADAGVPQPRFAAARTLAEARAAVEAVGLPAVLKPADSGGQRGVFLLESDDDVDVHLHAALAESGGGEAIVERYHDGLELNGLVLARGGEVIPLTLSDRLRPPGIGFGVGWIHVYPASIYGDLLAEAERVAVHAVHALGLRDGIAFPQLLVCDDGVVRVVEVAARIPGGQMADLARHAIGIDLVEVALRQALGVEVPDELAYPRYSQPLAIRFLTSSPGPLPAGRLLRWSGLERLASAPGVVQADVFLQPGETIRPVRLDGDRRGYVIAIADTNLEALDRAEAAARLLEVEVEPVDGSGPSPAAAAGDRASPARRSRGEAAPEPGKQATRTAGAASPGVAPLVPPATPPPGWGKTMTARRPARQGQNVPEVRQSLHTGQNGTCSFDLRHYEELLEAAQAGGYRFADFTRDPGPGDLLLRHDVDLSLEAALRMARIEADMGVRATYFLMTESVFYNLGSHVGANALAELRRLGHGVGLHAIHPRAELDDRFDPVVAWHNPDPPYVNEPIPGAANVMEPRFFDRNRYRSDSNQHWRQGCPHETLAGGEHEWLQLLVHPEIWAYPGDTMRETMLAMLDAERETRLTHLAHDRIDLS